jgi:DNA-binding transcriptional LysR family regulator
MTSGFDLWPRLDLRQIAAFEAVREARSFGTAAERLGYTQAAVSHQVATLERIVGHRLFDRRPGRGPVTLTAAGTAFADHAAAALARLSCARADLEAIAAGDRGTVRVGAFQSVSARLLPPLVHELATGEPPVAVELTESADDADLLARLARGALDFVFTLLPLDETRFEALEIVSDPYYLAGSREHGHPPDVDSLAELRGTPLIAPRTCRSWERITAQLQPAGVEPRYAFRTDDNAAVKGLVQRGVGVAFVTRLMLETAGQDLDVAPADHLVPPRRIALAWSRHRVLTPLHDRFIAITRKTAL